MHKATLFTTPEPKTALFCNELLNLKPAGNMNWPRLTGISSATNHIRPLPFPPYVHSLNWWGPIYSVYYNSLPFFPFFFPSCFNWIHFEIVETVFRYTKENQIKRQHNYGSRRRNKWYPCLSAQARYSVSMILLLLLMYFICRWYYITLSHLPSPRQAANLFDIQT